MLESIRNKVVLGAGVLMSASMGCAQHEPTAMVDRACVSGTVVAEHNEGSKDYVINVRGTDGREYLIQPDDEGANKGSIAGLSIQITEGKNVTFPTRSKTWDRELFNESRSGEIQVDDIMVGTPEA